MIAVEKSSPYTIYLYYVSMVLAMLSTQFIFSFFIGAKSLDGVFWLLFSSSLLIAFPALTGKRWLIYLIFLLVDILFYINILYCRNYLALVPVDTIQQGVGNLLMIRTSAASSMEYYDLLLFLPLIAMFVADRLKAKELKNKNNQWRISSLINLTLVTIIALIGILPHRDSIKEDFDLQFRFQSSRQGALHYGYFTYLAYSMKKYVSGRENITLSDQDKEDIRQYLEKKDKLCKAGNAFDHDMIQAPNRDTIPGKNIILLLVESLETFPLNQTVEGHEITPFLNSLFRDTASCYIPHIVTQVGIGRSSDGQFIVNTGLLPAQMGITAFIEGRKYGSLAAAFKESNPQGECVTLQTYSPTFWNQDKLSRMLSYDKTYNDIDFIQDEQIDHILCDKSLMRQSIPILKGLKKPFFAQIITASSHNMIDMGDKKAFRISDTYDREAGIYLELIHYVDAAIEQLFDSLQSNNLLQNTTVIITGDHNHFLSPYRLKVASNKKTLDLVGGYSYIPLIVYNGTKTGRYDKITGQVDLYPTLLDLMNLESHWKGIGTSVFSSSAPNAAINGRMELVGTATKQQEENLREAWKISDLLIRGEIFKEEK